MTVAYLLPTLSKTTVIMQGTKHDCHLSFSYREHEYSQYDEGDKVRKRQLSGNDTSTTPESLPKM